MVRLWRAGKRWSSRMRTSREGETLIKRIVSYVGYWSSTASRLSRFRATGRFRLLDRRYSEIVNCGEPRLLARVD